jgi:exopolysaccharide biosynthesis polyprenyl glycosylphosphotransferase
MLKQYRRQMSFIFQCFDFLLILFSFYIAYAVRYGDMTPAAATISPAFYAFGISYLIAWSFLANRFRLYTSNRLLRFRYEALHVVKTVSMTFLFALLFAFFFRREPVSRVFIVLVWCVQNGMLLALRFTVRKALRYVRKRGYNFRHVLIVGSNDRAAQIVQKIRQTPWFGFNIIGYVDSADNNNALHRANGMKNIGTLDTIEQILREQIVDEVFITLPVKSFYPEIEKIISQCEQMGVEAKIPLDLFKLKFAESTISAYDDIPCIDFYSSPKMTWQVMAKRMLDFSVSLIFLMLFSPVFLVVSILIKHDSPGPVFFRQKRVGYNGRLFTCLKFRTMINEAEMIRDELLHLNEMDGPVFKITNDPRITRTGKFLRETSLDELPQLLNVLKGDMSLVGPRPPIPSEVHHYELMNHRRLSVKPGMTCIWQVSGRNRISFKKWMEMDMQYIDQWSLWLDIKILLKTIPAVLKGSGAA